MYNQYRYSFAASVSNLPSSGTTVDLGIGQIGVFDGKTYQATNGSTSKSIIIAQGTPDTKWLAGVAKSNHTFKTDIIKGSAVRSWKKVNGKAGSTGVVTVGFDGVDTNKNLTVKKGKSFSYWVTMSGQPVANLLGDTPETHYATLTEQFTVELPCVGECEDTCDEVWDPNIVADAAIKSFNSRVIIGGQPITDYIKISKIVSCATPGGLPTTIFKVWNLTVTDDGSLNALGAVQSQYPGIVVKRASRNGLTSVYELTVADGVTPDPYVYTPAPVLPSCDTCPVGCPTDYTQQAAQDTWVISRPITNSDNLNDPAAQLAFAAAVQAAYGATAAEFLSFSAAAGAVKIYVAAGTAIVPVVASSDFVTQLGTNAVICTPNSGLTVTTAWVECKSCLAATKNFTLTVANDCQSTPSAILAELQAIYGAGVTLTTSNVSTCTSLYTLPVQSSNMDCDSCADIMWQFEAPEPFRGLVWTEVQGNAYGTDCNVGLKFESIYEQRKTKECFLKQVAYEFEPLFITLSTGNPDPNDTSVLCGDLVPVTVIKNPSYPVGLGRVVADHVIASNYQYNHPWYKNPAERDALEYELGIALDSYYDQYILEFSTFPHEALAVSGFGVSQSQTFELSVFYKVGTGVDFENAVTAFVASNSPLSLEVIL